MYGQRTHRMDRAASEAYTLLENAAQRSSKRIHARQDLINIAWIIRVSLSKVSLSQLHGGSRLRGGAWARLSHLVGAEH